MNWLFSFNLLKGLSTATRNKLMLKRKKQTSITVVSMQYVPAVYVSREKHKGKKKRKTKPPVTHRSGWHSADLLKHYWQCVGSNPVTPHSSCHVLDPFPSENRFGLRIPAALVNSRLCGHDIYQVHSSVTATNSALRHCEFLWIPIFQCFLRRLFLKRKNIQSGSFHAWIVISFLISPFPCNHNHFTPFYILRSLREN